MRIELPTTFKETLEVIFDGHDRQRSVMSEEALRAAFSEFPNALHAEAVLFRELWVNRDGQPSPVTRCTVVLAIPTVGHGGNR